jgi:hypothetical protein
MNDIFEKITNIDMIDHKSISLSKVLLVFYMLIAGNYLGGLVSKQMKNFIEGDRIVQHVIGIITMMILITSFGNVADIKLSILYSIIAYTWFILTTKLDIHINIIIVALLLVGYLYEDSLDAQMLKTDKVLTDVEKMAIVETSKKHKKIITGLLFLVTVIGTFMYNDKKQVQYGGGYDVFRYLLY